MKLVIICFSDISIFEHVTKSYKKIATIVNNFSSTAQTLLSHLINKSGIVASLFLILLAHH